MNSQLHPRRHGQHPVELFLVKDPWLVNGVRSLQSFLRRWYSAVLSTVNFTWALKSRPSTHQNRFSLSLAKPPGQPSSDPDMPSRGGVGTTSDDLSQHRPTFIAGVYRIPSRIEVARLHPRRFSALAEIGCLRAAVNTHDLRRTDSGHRECPWTLLVTSGDPSYAQPPHRSESLDE